jgi:hypothetical protein
MASRKSFFRYNLNKKKIKNAKLSNFAKIDILSYEQGLTSKDRGLLIYSIESNRILWWNGFVFTSIFGISDILDDVELLPDGCLTKIDDTVVSSVAGNGVGNIPIVESNGFLSQSIVPGIEAGSILFTGFAQAQSRNIVCETVVQAYDSTGIRPLTEFSITKVVDNGISTITIVKNSAGTSDITFFYL